MTKSPSVRRPTTRMTDRAFAPYALAIGHLTRSSNRLQETLCGIFVRLVTPTNLNIGWAIWGQVKSDATQREMIGAASGAPGAINKKLRPNAADDIKWTLKMAQELSGQRNAAVHSPFFVGQNTLTKEMTVGPHYFQNNKFALQFKKVENILVELEYYRMKADTINDYALRVHFALGHEDRPWPKRLVMPSREEAKSRTQSRQGRPKP
jgi:hypothetical protein